VSGVSGGVIRFAVPLIAVLAVAASAWQEPPADAPAHVQALIAEGLYEQAEAEARTEVDTLRARYGDDAPRVAHASDVLVRALILNGRGTHEQTLALARATLRTKEAQLGSSHPDVAASLINLGDVLAEAADFDEAIAVTRRAVALREQAAGARSLDLAEALDHLGGALSAAGRYDDALAALERSVLLKEQARDARDAGLARTLEDIGFALQRKGAYERAGPHLRRAAGIQETSSVEHPAYARTLNLLAQQLWLEGRLVESRDESERAVALAERTLRADHPVVAVSLGFLAGTLGDLGDTNRSRTLTERALAIAERNFGATHHVTAQYVHDLAFAELQEGAYASARARFQRALTIFERRYGPWHEFVATSLSMLARAEASLGDNASARRDQSRAVTVYEHVGGPNHPFVAVALTDLATIYRDQGAPAQSLRLLERALAIRETNLGPAHRDVARTLAQLASTLMQTGQTTRAQAAATRAIEIWERLDTPDAPEYATALALYAELQTRRGDAATARVYYERAMAIRARVFGPSNPAYAEAQAGLALAFARLGDRAAALTAAIGAEATGRDHLRTMLRSLPERQSLNYAAVRPRGLDLMLSLVGLVPDAAASAMDVLIRSRALVLDEMAARQSAHQTAGADSLRTAFTSAQQRVANLVVRGPGQLSTEQYRVVLEDARREEEAAEEALAERSAEFRAVRARAQLGLDDVRASLPADGTLVSFVRYGRTRFAGAATPSRNTATRASPPVAPSYLAFVLRPEGPPVLVTLGPAAAIDQLVSEWRADLAEEALAPAPAAGAVARGSRVSGAALKRLVWDPLATHLGAARRVFIVPDGALSLVPFVALPVGQRSYLLERAPVIHYLSAERDIVSAMADGTAVGKGLLALGGPAFDDTTLFSGAGNGSRAKPDRSPLSKASVRAVASPCASVESMTFTPLDGTRQEVQELSRLWNTSAIPGHEGSRILVGRNASESTFKKEARNYRVLHLATHGFFLGDSCGSARPGTRAVGRLAYTSGAEATPAAAENPLLLSGLALAGANRRQIAAENEDDGILTAEEVASLDLGGVEWAVLSACDTGVGQIKTGEGVFGLRRAFQVAGAHTVVMSLWSVDDQAARAWMRVLYERRFQKGLTTADAVHAASIATLHNRRANGQSTSPFYWAAFVAVGDWR
jgi:CHAT domain-containing protein/tetratricopeptide (TPR) repeat protein